ncbi:MAG: glycosyltransferase family 4 protein [Phycisphaerae bacterium]|nr:glycosyltransferase family 4 protein [Phycisphaerae bacterium]
MNDVKTKPLRVALIISEHTLGEYPMLLQNLLVGLADESIQVALVCPPGGDVDSIVSGPVEVIRHPAIDLPLIERFSRGALTRRLAEFEPSVVHCLCQSRASLAAYLARSLDKPYILNVNSLQKRWRPFAVSSTHCAKIAVPSRTIAANIAEFQGRFADRIEQINIGTFVAEKSCCFSELSRIATMVLAHPFGNVDDFENVFGAIRHMILDGYEFMTLVMGGGPGERKLRELVAALDLLGNVTIVPRMRPYRSVLAAGDIFIQPRSISAFNPFLLEAMSVGTAVAACKGGVDDLVAEDKTAVVFDPDDELSITATLKQLLGKREFAREIARAGQEYLRKNHSVSNMISATLQAYCNARQWYKSSKQ